MSPADPDRGKASKSPTENKGGGGVGQKQPSNSGRWTSYSTESCV